MHLSPPPVPPPSPVKAEAKRQARDAQVQRLGHGDYDAYLSSPEWKAICERYATSDLPQDCALCGAEREVFHHRTYERVGEEELSDLAPLCLPCHAFVHGLESSGYIESLDPAAVEALSDPDRAEQYRTAYIDLRDGQLQEFEGQRDADLLLWDRIRKKRNLLDKHCREARSLHADITPELDLALRAIRVKLKDARVARNERRRERRQERP